MKTDSEHEPRNNQGKRRVLLYGESLLLGAVGATLKQDSRLEIISLASPLTTQQLASLAPDVILFDVDGARPDAALASLKARPRLVLIGIDPSTDQMLLWSGHHSRALTMEDLADAIMNQSSPSPLLKRALAYMESLVNSFPHTHHSKS